MVDAQRLLADLKRPRKRLEDNLRRHHASSAGRAAVEAEWQEARETRRTADTFETFFGAALDQAAVHWILAAGAFPSAPGGQRRRVPARELRRGARLPGLAGLYDPAHNPLFRLPVSGDRARELFAFFRQRQAATTDLVHDFTDPDWNTCFLGDPYQDLSEEARKRYALLQTPDFVEAWMPDGRGG